MCIIWNEQKSFVLEIFPQFFFLARNENIFQGKIASRKKKWMKQCECICTNKNVYLLKHLTGFKGLIAVYQLKIFIV